MQLKYFKAIMDPPCQTCVSNLTFHTVDVDEHDAGQKFTV